MDAAGEDAILTALATATGLPTQWADQELQTPAGDFVRLRLGDTLPVADMDQVEEIALPDGQPDGEEVELRVTAHEELQLSVQAFTVQTVGPAAAANVLKRARRLLQLPHLRDVLRGAGLVLVDAARVQNLSEIAGADFEGRAAMDVTLRAAETESARVGYIATATLTAEDGSEIEGFTVQVQD